VEKLAGGVNEGCNCLGNFLFWIIAILLLWLAVAFLLGGLASLGGGAGPR